MYDNNNTIVDRVPAKLFPNVKGCGYPPIVDCDGRKIRRKVLKVVIGWAEDELKMRKLIDEKDDNIDYLWRFLIMESDRWTDGRTYNDSC